MDIIIWTGFVFVVGLLGSRIHISPLAGYLLACLGLAVDGFDRPVYVNAVRDDETEVLQQAGASAVPIPISRAGGRLADLAMQESAVK